MFSAITILKCSCGEAHPSALTLKPPGRFVCGNCLGRERGRREALCAKCRKIAPVHNHHVYGRGVSDETVEWCVNCHQKYHRGRSVQEIQQKEDSDRPEASQEASDHSKASQQASDGPEARRLASGA